MNNSIKGAIFSGLVFPGLGQVILKYYKRGKKRRTKSNRIVIQEVGRLYIIALFDNKGNKYTEYY